MSWLVHGVAYLAACAGMILLVVGVASVPETVVPRGLWWVASSPAVLLTSTVLAVLRIKGPPSSSE